ncbi:protein yippee-like 5 [Paramacrobiotus metropolitanus]|uniref:protein yippee-like 5 n=1 Tax=Paramacrobiotus metropolitanus TaxID=2943436 RepID=UPI0024464BCF|nr:protein yippee-like 5 [Paramacrobiotus metropolitanus]
MGVVHLAEPQYTTEHNPNKVFACASCDTVLTQHNLLRSRQFIGSTGAAILFRRAINVNFSEATERQFLTGQYMAKDVTCSRCAGRLGWYYERSFDPHFAFKETQVVLEVKLIKERDGTATELAAFHGNAED